MFKHSTVIVGYKMKAFGILHSRNYKEDRYTLSAQRRLGLFGW